MYQEDTLYDIYQTLISFGNYIHIQYLSDKVNIELDFSNNYEVDFQDHHGKNELTIGSTANSDIVIISEYKNIDIIGNNEAYMVFKIQIDKNTYIILTIKS